jgi:ectoine hydroxylase-related dioxygenase (phytanoyl-CoA dioxygenase family)
MPAMPNIAAKPTNESNLQEHGFAIVPNVFSRSEVEMLSNALGLISGAGRRGLMTLPAVAEVAKSERLLHLIQPHVGSRAMPVRTIYFDKSAVVNWLVAWHQDLTLAVRARVDVPDFGPWSVKDGVPHVQAPVQVLERMLTVRIHLDDCDETNGALRVLPGSHRFGRLSSEQIRALRKQTTEVVCRASAGDIMLMRPLLLHASGKARANRHRRVLHIEYAGCDLPGGLEWHERLC